MNYYIRGGLILLLSAMMAACKLSKDVAATPQPLPGSFRNAATGADTTTITSLHWRELFTDPALQQLIDTALVHNYDLQIAAKNIKAAQSVWRQSKWGYVPDIRLQVNAGINRPSDNSLNGISASQFLGTTHIEDFTAALNLNWEADIWGKVKNQKKSARAALTQVEEVRKDLQNRLVASLAQGYYNLLMLDAQLDIAHRNLALSDSTLQIIRLQYNAGQVTSLGVRQAEAQQLVASALVPQLEQAVLLQENALSVLSGQLPGSIRRTVLPEVSPFRSYTAGVPASLLEQRPDVHIAAQALEIANARVGIAKASMYPALTITAGGGINSFKASNWFNIPASLFGTVAGGLAQPLLMRRQLRTQYELAQTDREKAVLQFRQTVLTAVGEVSDALAQLEKSAAQQEIVEQKVATLQQAIGQAGMLFKSGMATYLEVITAQGNLLQSELELATVKRAQLSASIALYRSLGGGWQ